MISLKTISYALIPIILLSCANNFTLSKRAQEQQSEKRLLEIKRAILDLDFLRVDTLSRSIDLNTPLADNSSLLAWATETQEPDLVDLLLHRGAKLNTHATNRFSPLIIACSHGNAEIIDLLLTHGGEPNSALEDGTSAFQLCAGSTSKKSLEYMVELGADVHHQNKYGQTSLMFASNSGLTDNIRYLISKGAEINTQTSEGYSPLLFAIKSHNLDAAQLLISEGANISVKTSNETSATQLGVYAKNYEFLTWLVTNIESLMTVDSIADTLNAHDRNGHQLLHAAVLANQPQLVAALLQQGADVNEVSAPSKLTWRYEANFKTEDYLPPQLTPLEFAEKYEFGDIVSLLSEKIETEKLAARASVE